MKTANSLLAMAFGFRSFFVNLLVPHAMIKYLKVKMILYKNYLWSTTQITGAKVGTILDLSELHKSTKGGFFQ